ncbi:Ataxin-7-like protein 1 [Geodia barretti]|uniref:Ataxin-7-like protein 1 n=1 Tax=Geodia barretti TaxID=519541 RepID=A0AA35QYX6_GEOBA|nr:Ataxin-7-like protein 1 [Geodia barretti]
MEGGRGARRQGTLSSSTGCSWASFEEKAKDYELKSGLLGPSRNPFSPTTRQLCREDMAIYGEEPASDSLALVVCEQCGRVVKSQALSKHKGEEEGKVGRGRKGKKEEKERGKAHKKKRTERESKEDDRDVTVVFSFPELYHSKVFHIPPPKHIGHHSRIHTVGQPSVGGLTDEPRGQFPAPVVAPQRRGSTSVGGLTDEPRGQFPAPVVAPQRRGSTSVGGLTDEPRGQFPAPVVAPQRRGSTSGGGGVMGFAATELPRQNSSGSGGVGTMGGERGAEDGNSGSGRSSKEYDPNRHCGVWVEEEKRNCTRSLTCKFHPLSQKGRVQGRSRPFAELLDEHRRRKKLKKQGKLSGGGHTPSLPHPSPSELVYLSVCCGSWREVVVKIMKTSAIDSSPSLPSSTPGPTDSAHIPPELCPFPPR